MKRAPKGWITVILIVTFLSSVFLVPTFLGDRLPAWWGKVFPVKGLRLGLDLRGGVFLLLGVDPEKAAQHELANMKDSILTQLKEKKVLVKKGFVDGHTLHIELFSSEDLSKIEDVLSTYKNVADIKRDGASVEIMLRDRYVRDVQSRTLDQVIQVIRNRIDEFGVLEPAIQRVGSDRILIQVPGASASDRQRIIRIINRSAVLEFKIVRDAGPDKVSLLAKHGIDVDGLSDTEVNRLLREKGLALHPGGEGLPANERYFLTDAEAPVTGQYLSDARLTFDDYGRPAVGFSFKGEGATKFGELTEKNIGHRLAIVLDGVVKSAPVINDRITTNGIITGTFTTDEARDLALVLRSGALPVPVEVLEERTVGPSLGRDSIEKGKFSMIVGGAMVLLFMLAYYKRQGIIADVALLFNMLFILGFLSAFGVTLTLPGIAGLVLTMGMAVDGNIIIFERIKEELSAGKTPLAAIEAGYSRSLWTVLDANITTLLTALILFWFGTGPVKGFAVTLSVGIVTTIFSNVVVAKVITDLVYGGRKVEALSI